MFVSLMDIYLAFLSLLLFIYEDTWRTQNAVLVYIHFSHNHDILSHNTLIFSMNLNSMKVGAYTYLVHSFRCSKVSHHRMTKPQFGPFFY